MAFPRKTPSIELYREPLEALLDEGLDDEVVILVDALDEALSSLSHLLLLLYSPRLTICPLAVRFILTTRQESRVENEFRHVNELSLSIPNDQRNQDDIGRYVKILLQVDLELAAKAEQVEPRQSN